LYDSFYEIAKIWQFERFSGLLAVEISIEWAKARQTPSVLPGHEILNTNQKKEGFLWFYKMYPNSPQAGKFQRINTLFLLYRVNTILFLQPW
jgi:hypothetical protein